jgi:hypothetical protein
LPFLQQLTSLGPEASLRTNDTLARGFYTFNGYCLKQKIAQPLGLPFLNPESESNFEYAR